MTPEETHGATKVADAVHDHHPVSSDLVRGARPGSRILLILIVSAGAAAVLLLGMWFVSNSGFVSQNPGTAERAANTQAFDDGSAAASSPRTAPAP